MQAASGQCQQCRRNHLASWQSRRLTHLIHPKIILFWCSLQSFHRKWTSYRQIGKWRHLRRDHPKTWNLQQIRNENHDVKNHLISTNHPKMIHQHLFPHLYHSVLFLTHHFYFCFSFFIKLRYLTTLYQLSLSD